MNKNVKKIRAYLKTQIDFDFWVRAWNDEAISCGSNFGSEKRMLAMVEALNAAGYDPQTKGKQGTSGEFMIDLIFPLDD